MTELLAPRHLKAVDSARAAVDVGAPVRVVPATAGATTTAKWRKAPSMSCIIPCRNEAQNLARLLPLLATTLNACTPAWEVVLVDDGSTDDTMTVMGQWARRPGFRVVQLSRNFGKEAALTAGLRAAIGAVVVTMDADLQHSPALIPVFLDHWRAGADVAYGARDSRSDESLFKRLGSRGFYALINRANGVRVPPDAGDFRLMDRTVVDALLSLPERNRFMKGLYAWVGFNAIAVPYTPAPRLYGHSHFNPLRLIGLSLDGLTAFTTWPLRAVSAAGSVLALLAFVYGAYLMLSYILYGHLVSGWTTIVVSLMGFAGIQLISVGVVGEYVGRIFEEVKARPLYVVKRELGRGLKATPQ